MSAPAETAPSASTTATWLRTGQRQEATGQLGEALACYDRALAAMGRMAPESGLVWMNRGSALQRCGDREHTQAALEAYDEAIVRLRPQAGDPDRGVSLAAALMNRGLLLHRLHGTAQAAAALAAYAEAEELLVSPENHAPSMTLRRNLAGVRVNRSNLLLDLDVAKAGATAAREAIATVDSVAHADFECAGVALMARRALCDALGRLLVAPGADQDTLAAEASDVVDDALALVRHWGPAGRAAFAPLMTRLYRYGARLYRAHQPHFLGEFLFENLAVPASPELIDIASEALAGALADLQRTQPLVAGNAATERVLALARDLRAAQAHLASFVPDAGFPS